MSTIRLLFVSQQLNEITQFNSQETASYQNNFNSLKKKYYSVYILTSDPLNMDPFHCNTVNCGSSVHHILHKKQNKQKPTEFLQNR